jgi:hypothetical protein
MQVCSLFVLEVKPQKIKAHMAAFPHCRYGAVSIAAERFSAIQSGPAQQGLGSREHRRANRKIILPCDASSHSF